MISRNNLLKYIAFAASIFVNLLSFMSFATELFQLDIKWVPDEICTLTKSPTSSIVNQITGSTYYLLLVVPLIVGIINFFMIKHLNSQASTNLNLKFKQTESKIIFINLIIQTIQPFFGHWPSTFFSFYLKSTGHNIYVVWRILDGLVALSLVSNILFSIIFIKDVRNTIFRRESSKAVSKVTNIVSIKIDNLLKFNQQKSLVV